MKILEKSQLNKSVILSLDCTERNALVAIYDLKNNLISKQIISDDCVLSSELLITVDKMLSDNKLLKSDIDSISVNPGPGSYTGLRIGLTVANFLAFCFNIPIREVTFAHDDGGDEVLQEDAMTTFDLENFVCPVMPVYAKPPHITKPKSGR